MKKTSYLGWLIMLLLTTLFGCVQTQGIPGLDQSPGVPLDRCLQEKVIPTLVEQMRGNSFIKGLPFIIVKAEGEVVSNQIDGLTEDIREMMTSVLLQDPGIPLVRRHPVEVIDRPYKLQEVRCGHYIEHKMLLTLDIKRLGQASDNLARLNVRAIDLRKDSWVPGFSIFETVALRPDQSRSLGALHPDQYLRGLKYVPFTDIQADELGAYLARNLSCIFREGVGDRDIKIYADFSQVRRKDKNVMWFMLRQLRYCGEITMASARENADWVLVAESKDVSANLAQLWVEVMKREGGEFVKGLATHAYFRTGGEGSGGLLGRWEIRDLPDRKVSGALEITGSPGKYVGDLFTDKGAIRKRGVSINVRGRDVDWTFYDDRERKTYDCKGVILDEGGKISVDVTTFPSSGKAIKQELMIAE